MSPRSKYARPAADQCHILVFYGIGGQGKTALCKKLREILADDSPHRAVWGHLNLEEIPLREPARGLLQLRKTLRESGRITFTAFDVAIATYWEKAYPAEDVGKALKDILSDSESVLGSIADNARQPVVFLDTYEALWSDKTGLADGDAEEFLQLILIHEAAIRHAMIAAAKAENSPPLECKIHLANAGQGESCAPSHAGFPGAE